MPSPAACSFLTWKTPSLSTPDAISLLRSVENQAHLKALLARTAAQLPWAA